VVTTYEGHYRAQFEAAAMKSLSKLADGEFA